MMYPIVLKNESKQKLCNHLEWIGVETRDMLPLINQPFYKDYFVNPKIDYPISDHIIENGFYIGCHPYMTPEMLDHVCESFEMYYNKSTIKSKNTSALIVITSSNVQITEAMFSKIDCSMFNRIIVFDSYNTFKADTFLNIKNVKIIKNQTKTLLDIYKKSIDLITEDYIVFFYLDGSQAPEDIPKLLSHIKLGYDLVIASRFLPGGKRYDSDYIIPLRGVGNRFITFMLNLMFDANLIDSYQPFRAVSRNFIIEADLNSKYLPNYQMSIRAVLHQKKIFELPTNEGKSVDSKHFFSVVNIGLLSIQRLLIEKFKQYFRLIKNRKSVKG